MKNLYVKQLAEEVQENIYTQLVELGLDQMDIENAMDSKLADLSELIDIKAVK